jgi:2-polyprenyl-3-methyl-5-hydroxy-6-metoxy-1,4-benzoquinol methylase
MQAGIRALRESRRHATAGELESIYGIERQKWDALVPKTFELRDLQPKDADFWAYQQRVTTLPDVKEFLGDLAGKRVLEYGCGLGQISVLLAKSGAYVTGFDLSAESVAFARKLAETNGVADRIQLDVFPAEELGYADESFDVIFGKAILHHLAPSAAQPHLYRVLKPDGKAVFSEPMGMNPVLNFVRDYVHYPKKNPRGADRPLNYDEVYLWAKGFSSIQIREIQLLSMLERGIGFNSRLHILRRADKILLSAFPGLRRYCRYVVMLMTK